MKGQAFSKVSMSHFVVARSTYPIPILTTAITPIPIIKHLCCPPPATDFDINRIRRALYPETTMSNLISGESCEVESPHDIEQLKKRGSRILHSSYLF